jgi:glycosyltransferase involved in cell wall biosynthesis
MNILYILQQSIYNNETPPKWLTLDSNINMAVGAITNILKLRPDWHFHVLIAPLSDFANIESYDEIASHPNVHFIPYPFPVNAFLNRQHFDTAQFGSVIKGLSESGVAIDVVWNNITELTRNIKTWFFCHKQYPTPKFITCCYWLDCQEIAGQSKVDSSIAYQWRQFDGFQCSDLAAFTCGSTRSAFFENGRRALGLENKYLSTIFESSTIWDFGYSAGEIERFRADPQVWQLQKELRDAANGAPIVVFLNRMSDNNYTRHLEFIAAVNLLAETVRDYRVVFANPSQKIPWERLEQSTTNVLKWRDRALTRQEYFALLMTADVSVHLYENELYGGCAHREAVHAGAKIVCPRVNEYAQIHGPNWPWYCDVTPQSIAEAIGSAINNTNSNDNSKLLESARQNCYNMSAFENVASQVVADIEGAMRELVPIWLDDVNIPALKPFADAYRKIGKTQ